MNETEKSFAPLMALDLLGLGVVNISDDDACKLSKDPSAATRATIASSSKTSATILSMLAKDPVQLVRIFVATNPSTPGPVLERLENDSEPRVQCMVRELDLCSDILVALLDHRNPYVRTQAKLTLAGRKFENQLKEMGHRLISDGDYRLGDLLVKSQLVKQKDIDDSLRECKLCGLPLGRGLLQSGLASPMVLLTVLKLQSLIRQGSMRPVDAINELVKFHLADE